MFQSLASDGDQNIYLIEQLLLKPPHDQVHWGAAGPCSVDYNILAMQ